MSSSEITFKPEDRNGHFSIEELLSILEQYPGWDYKIETRGFMKQRIKKITLFPKIEVKE